MKIATSKHSDAPTKKALLLPLVPDPLDEMTSNNSISYMLRMATTDAASATFKKYIHVLTRSETVRTMLRWAQDTNQVLVGLNVTAGPAQFNMYMNMVQGIAMALFYLYAAEAAETVLEAAINAAADAVAAQAVRGAGFEPHLTVAMISQAKRLTLQALIPNKIVAMVERYLRRDCHKPVDMKVRTY
jgi:hypothetical protein